MATRPPSSPSLTLMTPSLYPARPLSHHDAYPTADAIVPPKPRTPRPFYFLLLALALIAAAITLYFVFRPNTTPPSDTADSPPSTSTPASPTPGLHSSAGVLHLGPAPFHLKGISWYGMEEPLAAPGGLQTVALPTLLATLAANDFNAIRLPLALDNYLTNAVPNPAAISPSANPALRLLTYRQLLTALVDAAADAHLLVLLDLHRLHSNTWPSDGLWYSPTFDVETVISAWEALATDLGSRWNVIGADIYNESWAHWRAFAEAAGDRILAVAPTWLIFVEGVGALPGAPTKHPVFWAENLQPASRDTPQLSSQEKLVLSPHVYGPSVHMQPYFRDDMSFPRNMQAIWDDHFGVAVASGAAVVVGEFGGRNTGADARWHTAFVDYMAAKRFGSFYWCVNPTSNDTAGFLLDDWRTVDKRKALTLSALKSTSVQDNMEHFQT